MNTANLMYKLNDKGEAVDAYMQYDHKLTPQQFYEICDKGFIGDAEKVRLWVDEVMGCGEEGGVMVLDFYALGDIKEIAHLLTCKGGYDSMERASQMIHKALKPMIDRNLKMLKQAVKDYNRNRK